MNPDAGYNRLISSRFIMHGNRYKVAFLINDSCNPLSLLSGWVSIAY